MAEAPVLDPLGWLWDQIWPDSVGDWVMAVIAILLVALLIRVKRSGR